MTLAYLHGEGIFFSFLAHIFFALIGGGALLWGLVKYQSWAGSVTAAGYGAVALIMIVLSQSLSSLLIETIVWALTLPWNQIVPCYNLDRECQMSPAMALICAVMNGAVLYFVIAWAARANEHDSVRQ